MRVITVLTCACVLTQVGVSVVRADLHTFAPTPADLWDLEHDWHYTWGLQWVVPDGETIISAVLTYSAIDDWIHPEDDHLYTHLLDYVAPPADDPTSENWVISGKDWQDDQDQFADQGRLLGDFSDDGPGEQNLSYTIPDTCFALLADGNFGFGIDPDCHYSNDGITLTIETTHLPAPGAALLGVIGLGLVGWVRRRFG